MASKSNGVSGEREYKFPHQVRGIAIVISNEIFKSAKPRHYADIELHKMNEMFEGLGYIVMLFKDLTALQMYEVIRTATCKEMDFFLEKSDSFACVLASHGNEVQEDSPADPKVKVYHHVIHGTNGGIKTHLILDLLDENRCNKLQGKPKLFFVQACRSRFGQDPSCFDGGVVVPSKRFRPNPGQNRDQTEGLSKDSASHHEELGDGCGDQVDVSEGSDTGHHPNPKPTGDTATEDCKEEVGEDGCENEVTPNEKMTTELHYQLCLDVEIIREETKDIYEETKDICEDPSIIERGENWITKQFFRKRMVAARTVRDADEVTTVVTPCHNDFLIMYSTSEGKVGFGREELGGWLLHVTHEIMSEHIDIIGKNPQNSFDFLSVMTYVMHKIGVDFETDTEDPLTSGLKTAPTLQHKLSKDLIFRKKYIS